MSKSACRRFAAQEVENGTTVEAYDVDGKLIGSITNLQPFKVNSDFMAAKSMTPIHYLRIVPNEDIDPDFAIDDLAFTTPEKVE